MCVSIVFDISMFTLQERYKGVYLRAEMLPTVSQFSSIHHDANVLCQVNTGSSGSLVVDDEIELEVREIQSIPTHVAVSHPPLSKWVFW